MTDHNANFWIIPTYLSVFAAGLLCASLACMVLRISPDAATRQAMAFGDGRVSLIELHVRPTSAADFLSREISLPYLRSLSLTSSDIDNADVNPRLELPNLEQLSLSHTKCRATLPKICLNTPNLEVLIANNCSLDDASILGIRHLSQLKVLTLSDNPISDGSIPHIVQLDNLEVLQIEDTLISADGLRSLYLARPHMKVAHSAKFPRAM